MAICLSVPPEKLEQARNSYFSKQGSIRAIAERFDIPESTLQRYAAKNGWKKQRNTIEQGQSNLVTEMSQRVVEKTSEKTSEAIASHLKRVLCTGNDFVSKLQDKLASALIPDITRLDHAETATRVFRSWDDLIRRAHGLSDPRSGVDITTGGLPMHDKALSILSQCTSLIKDGKVIPADIDVTALSHEMELDKVKPADDAKSADTASASDAATDKSAKV